VRGRGLLGVAAAALAVGALGAGGCLDLDLPPAPTAAPKPALALLTPQPGDTIALTSQVSVSASSVDGIASVSLLCGPLDGGARTAFVWTAPPYRALVDFSPCEGLTQPVPGGFPRLPLAVQAATDAGAFSEVDVEVQLDATGPVVFALYAPTVQPKSLFTVTILSDRALLSIPLVVLDGNPADSTTAVPNPDGGPPTTYLATFVSTPGLGTDGYHYVPNQPIPIEVLTETARPVRLTVDARALNGNATHLDLSVELSRTVWDRYIPGQPAETNSTWAAEPVAFAGGLALPLATSAPAGSNSAWLPGLLRAEDGTFVPFVGQLPVDGGYRARGINALGETLFAASSGGGLLLATPGGGAFLGGNFAGAVTPPLTAADTLLCLPTTLAACTDAGTESLTCFTPQLSTVTVTSGLAATGPPAPGVVAGAGGRYLAPNVAVCGSSWNLVDFDAGTISFGPTVDPNGATRNCVIQAVSKLLAVGDGTFVVQLTSRCAPAAGLVTAEYPILRVGTGSSILGAYTAPLGTPAPLQREVVAALADGGVVTLSNQPPTTNFELWGLNQPSPDIISPIAGLYETVDAVQGSILGRSSYAGVEGSFAVLLSGAPLGVGLLAFGPALRPLWLYLYPRVTNSATARLISGPAVQDVYFVDSFNNYAVSLRVQPVPPDGGSGIPDAGPPPDAGSDAGPDAGTGVVCGTANGTVVTHSANINASETWAGDGVTHFVPNSISINSPATVTVEPCALVALAQSASITVSAGGTLLAAGTSAAQFVSFQRADSTKAWGILRGTSTTSASGFIELHWTFVQGGGAFGGQYGNPAIAMAGLGYSALPTPMLKVDNVVIDTPQGVGIYFDGNAAFTSDSQSLTVQNAPGYVFETTMMSVGSIPSGTYTSGNALPFAFVDVGPNANVFADMTISNRLPVHINYGGMNVGPPGGSGAPVTLTLGPGVQLFFNGTRVVFGGNGNPPNNSVGVLHALGTAAQPILFTSAKPSPAPGDWVGLWLDTATGSQLDYVIIEYAGAVSGIVSANCKPAATSDNAALIVGDFSTQYVPPAALITNSVIRHNAGFGIDAIWQAATFNAPDLTATNTFQNNAGCAQTYNALSSGSCPNGGGCTAP
jgi:hypothetical protein